MTREFSLKKDLPTRNQNIQIGKLGIMQLILIVLVLFIAHILPDFPFKTSIRVGLDIGIVVLGILMMRLYWLYIKGM